MKTILDQLFAKEISMAGFWKALAHAAIGGAATAVVTAGSGITGFKQLGMIAASSALTSVLSLFAQSPTIPAQK